jgi:hypothetical protein
MSEKINMNNSNNSPPTIPKRQQANGQILFLRKESGAADQFLENWGEQGVSRLESHTHTNLVGLNVC